MNPKRRRRRRSLSSPEFTATSDELSKPAGASPPAACPIVAPTSTGSGSGSVIGIGAAATTGSEAAAGGVDMAGVSGSTGRPSVALG